MRRNPPDHERGGPSPFSSYPPVVELRDRRVTRGYAAQGRCKEDAMSYAFMPDALEANAAGQLTDAQHAMFAEGSFVMRLMPTVTGDLHKGAVAVVEGALRKKMPINVSQSPESSGMQLHALEVEGVDYEVPSRRVWDEVPTTGWVRLYYLPRSRVTVNLEILPDPAVDASPQMSSVRCVTSSPRR